MQSATLLPPAGQHQPPHMVNILTVRILLECNLVLCKLAVQRNKVFGYFSSYLKDDHILIK